ncbi:11059_t:CDS:2, partial [Paraglomus brasilianum]
SLSASKQHSSNLDNYEEEQQRNVKKIRSYPSPSSFALLSNLIGYQIKDKQLLIHRPPECVGPPVQVYHNVFSQFLHDYHNEDLKMRREHYQWTLDIIHGMAELYHSESDRSKVFREKIRELFGEELRIIHLEDNSSNDGVLESNVFSRSVLHCFVEIKNEIGTGSCDLTVQAGASFAKYYTQQTNRAVYIEKPIIDPLTDFIPLIPTNNQAHAEHQDTIIEFTYEGKLVDDKLLWKAITRDGWKIIVKFASQYNQKAHELCSEIGKAPKLLYVNKEIVDGFYMVVMDFVEAEPLYNCSSLSHDEYKAILMDIEEAIDKLHTENIVFADLHDSNILVSKSQGQYQGMLIDFDWAGKEEIDCYPSFMNHRHINWPPGAEDQKKLSREHDIYWLESLKSRYLGQMIS